MMTKLAFDESFLRQLYGQSQATLLEMAAPSYLHPSPFIRWIVRKRMQVALGYLDISGGKTLLDFGCGAGILFLQLPPRQNAYLGVDLEIWPAQQMLAHHQRDDVRLFEGEAWVNSVADHSLDNIVALEVLEHVADLPAVLKLFRRKLAPGGRLVVSGPTENALYKLARRIAGFSGHYHLRNIFDIRHAVADAGFSEEQRKALPLPGPLALFLVIQYSRTG
ncbi:MAG: class I SAM-dependent methyltransferase [Anaerolineales bacterium]